MTLRRTLLAGSSVLAINAALAVTGLVAIAQPALAADQTINSSISNTTISGGDNLIITDAGDVSGAGVGISVTGNNGTLANSGTVSGNYTGVSLDGSGGLSALINTRVISGGYTGIYTSSGATIGTLTNSGTISGGTVGLNNSGSIGTLTNSGIISASGSSATVINSAGSIGTLTNNGIISASGSSATAIKSSGNITALINNGTISSNYTSVYVSGSIGTLSNSGTISSSNNGALNVGGSIGSIGMLTNSGVITSTSSAGINVYMSGSIGVLSNSGTISGGQTGVYVDGSIGVLSNSGIISGGTTGVYVSGSIGTLSNSGTISGGSTGVSVGGSIGSIGTLSNSGTISGYNAIYANGSIGAIANSGVIDGNIIYNPASTLTITGGAGDTFGTLMGGSIATGGNLLFGGGNLLLKDDVNVAYGMGTVTNNGVLQVNDHRTISGNYAQTANGKLVIGVTSPSSYGELLVTQAASMANGQVVIKALGGATLANGQSYTILDSTGALSAAGVTATATGYKASVSSVDVGGHHTLVVTFGDKASTYADIGKEAGGAGTGMGETLDELSRSGNAAFQEILSKMDDLAPEQKKKAVKQLAPSQTGQMMQAANLSVGQTTGAVGQHQQAMMASPDAPTGIAAGSEYRNKAMWGQALGGWAQRDSSHGVDGYRTKSYGLVAGADLQATPDLLAGVAVSWLHADADGLDNASGSSTGLNSYQITGYGTYRLGAAFIDGQVGFGYNNYDQDRAIGFLGSTAHASYDGQQYLGKLTGGYDIPAGPAVVTPLASFQAVHVANDGYSESGAGAANLTVDSQSFNSLSSELGAKLAWTEQTGLGKLTPEVKLAWGHDYTHAPIATTGILGGVGFATTTERPSADAAKLSLAATLEQSDELSLRLEYDGELRSDYQSHSGLFKAQVNF